MENLRCSSSELKFNEALEFVLTNKMSSTEYQGISRKYFPKWEGWVLVDANKNVPHRLVQEFYKKYFWDVLKEQKGPVMNLMFVFSVLAGKNKLKAKVERVSKHAPIDSPRFFLELYAECTELYIQQGALRELKVLCKVYYSYLQSNALGSAKGPLK